MTNVPKSTLILNFIMDYEEYSELFPVITKSYWYWTIVFESSIGSSILNTEFFNKFKIVSFL